MKSFLQIVCAAAMGLCPVAMGLVPNDTLFQYQWPLKNTGGLLADGITPNKVGADMHLEEAWDITTGDSSIIVAILDTGCKWNWPDLINRIWVNRGEIEGNGIDDDGNGFIDDVRGWNFHDNNNDIMDLDGHGTSVASVLGSATNNTEGFAGVDWKCKLMILKDGRENGEGLLKNSTNAIRYAIQMNASVINISAGAIGALLSIEYIDAISQAIQAGIIVVVGAGNEGLEPLSSLAELPGVIAVGATGPDDSRAHNPLNGGTGSNFGSRLDLIAPGEYIPTLDVFAAEPYNQLRSGTSASAPHVSGVVSLLLAQNPRRTPAQIRDLLCQTADDLVGDPAEDTPGRDKYYGCGRVNAYRALSAVGSLKPRRFRFQESAAVLSLYTLNGRKVFGIQKERRLRPFGLPAGFGP
jgi:subtilisin family serine protease